MESDPDPDRVPLPLRYVLCLCCVILCCSNRTATIRPVRVFVSHGVVLFRRLRLVGDAKSKDPPLCKALA
jgi:hypothetical protein